MSHLTGKQTGAEFAENAEIIEMLRSPGVDCALRLMAAIRRRE